jgi:hypothetical protein
LAVGQAKTNFIAIIGQQMGVHVPQQLEQFPSEDAVLSVISRPSKQHFDDLYLKAISIVPYLQHNYFLLQDIFFCASSISDIAEVDQPSWVYLLRKNKNFRLYHYMLTHMSENSLK